MPRRSDFISGGGFGAGEGFGVCTETLPLTVLSGGPAFSGAAGSFRELDDRGVFAPAGVPPPAAISEEGPISVTNAAISCEPAVVSQVRKYCSRSACISRQLW